MRDARRLESLVRFDLPPPKTWEQFEELCADTFAALWSDPALVRHGRSGQRQLGVDIVCRPGGRWTGLQCKRTRVWPPRTITKVDIDAEVRKALQFKPRLEDFWILSTAQDDVHLQEHVRRLTEKHEKAKRFTVHLLGWQEIIRRATLYPLVVTKHFGVTAATTRAPLLAVWSASKGELDVSDDELTIRCRELVHEINRYPSGRILVRQREADGLEQRLMRYVGRDLTLTQRARRLALQDQLARKERQEARVAQGLRLLFTDPSIRWTFELLEGPGMARAVRHYVQMELGPIGERGLPTISSMRMEARGHGNYFRTERRLTPSEQAMILARDKHLRDRFGPNARCDAVSELPPDLKSAIAIPAISRRIVNELHKQTEGDPGWTLEKMRAEGILDFYQWTVQLV